MRYATCRYGRTSRSDSRSTFRDACPAERQPCSNLSGRIKTYLRPCDFRQRFSFISGAADGRENHTSLVWRRGGSLDRVPAVLSSGTSARIFLLAPAFADVVCQVAKPGPRRCCLVRAFLCCRFCRKHHGSRLAWKTPRPIFCCCLRLLSDCPTFCSRQPARCCNRGTRARGSARFPTASTHFRILDPCWLF